MQRQQCSTLRLAKPSDAKRSEDASRIAETLRKDFPKSPYAVFATLSQAEIAAGKGDLKAAAATLESANQLASNASMKSLIALRQARVNLALGDAEAALSQLDRVAKTDYPDLAGELRGDVLAKLGRAEDARAAYTEALTHMDLQSPNRSFVEMKLGDLSVPSRAGEAEIMKRALLAVAIVSAALGGCNWIKNLGKKDNVEPPTALVEFAPSINVETVWTASIGKGAGKSGAHMHPVIAGDRLFVASVDGAVQALDASNGRTLWSPARQEIALVRRPRSERRSRRGRVVGWPGSRLFSRGRQRSLANTAEFRNHLRPGDSRWRRRGPLPGRPTVRP